MKNHTLNMFPVSNTGEIDFSYKLIAFEMPVVGETKGETSRRLNKLAQAVASLIKRPAVLIFRQGGRYIAIPADSEFGEQKMDAGSLLISLKPINGIFKTTGASDDAADQEIFFKFLDYEIRLQLTASSLLWKMSTGAFFQKKPETLQVRSNVNIFRGFNYKLVRLEDGMVYLVLDISSKYVDKRRFSLLINSGNVKYQGKRFIKTKLLYLNNENWYPIELLGFGESIEHHTFLKDNKEWTVQNYILSRAGRRLEDVKRVLNPKDLAIMYRYPGREMEPHNGASSLAKLLYTTDDPEVRALHKYSIKDPSVRFQQIQQFIRTYFKDISFNGKQLKIDTEPLMERVKSFNVPGLRYSNNKMLKVSTNGEGIGLKEYGYNRKSFVEKNGILNDKTFDPQFLMVPVSMDKHLAEAIKNELEVEIRKLAPKFRSFQTVRYPYTEGLSATLQMQAIDKALSQQGAKSGYGLFLLPDISSESRINIRSFHNLLKNKFYPDLQLQCASAYKLSSFFTKVASAGDAEPLGYKILTENEARFDSYSFNLMMEFFIVNRKWPFSLEKQLHYDLYIGIDVHDRYAGFSFFFKDGAQLFFSYKQVPKKGRSARAEKLKAGLLYDVLYERLKSLLPTITSAPNGIVIIRDGRSFGEEEDALAKVITDLQKDGVIKNKPLTGVIDLHKRSAIPFRAALQTNGHEHLVNPRIGTYKTFNDQEGFIFNTGFPFGIRGTAKPLHLSMRAGDVSFVKVMEDIFSQSMLAFSAPDRSNRLPVVIKLIDILLQPLSASTEEQEEDEEIEDLYER